MVGGGGGGGRGGGVGGTAEHVGSNWKQIWVLKPGVKFLWLSAEMCKVYCHYVGSLAQRGRGATGSMPREVNVPLRVPRNVSNDMYLP